MGEELDWELMDIFESGIFAFPVNDHNSARRIVRYLLYRGVIDEDIADAIEDSVSDLHLWLNRGGKFMVGEWVMAWINDTRDEYYKERGIELSVHGESDRELNMRDFESDSETSQDGDDQGGSGTMRFCKLRRHGHSQAGRSRLSRHSAESGSEFFDSDSDFHDETHVKQIESPPRHPPRSLRERRLLRRNEDYSDLDLNKLEVDKLDIFGSKDSAAELNASDEQLNDEVYTHPDPDSGAVSDLYSCIPNDRIFDDLSIEHESCSLGQSSSQATSDSRDLPSCNNCTCTLAHYSYISGQPSSPTDKDLSPHQHDSYCELFLNDSAIDRAMDFTFDTLDQDGPGYIFIMTDSIHNCLAWNVEHRYRIASSRHPERCLLEFRARNINIELIWQTKVNQHLKAVKEVHADLMAYNVRSNWFKCPLSTVMDTMAKVVSRYKAHGQTRE